MKFIVSIFLCLLISTHSYGNGLSCSEQLETKLVAHKKRGKEVVAGAFAVGIIVVATTMSSSEGNKKSSDTGEGSLFTGGFVLMGLAFAGVITYVLAPFHKKQVLKIFNGAANGGNDLTEKLWKKANRKAPEIFGKTTYAEFLKKIHDGDVSGEACKSMPVPNKKEIIKVVKLDMEDDGDIVNNEDNLKVNENNKNNILKRETGNINFDKTLDTSRD